MKYREWHTAETDLTSFVYFCTWSKGWKKVRIEPTTQDMLPIAFIYMLDSIRASAEKIHVALIIEPIILIRRYDKTWWLFLNIIFYIGSGQRRIITLVWISSNCVYAYHISSLMKKRAQTIAWRQTFSVSEKMCCLHVYITLRKWELLEWTEW